MDNPNTPQGTVGDPQGNPTEPVTLESLAAQLQEMRQTQESERGRYQEEIQKLREDKARLEGQIAGGGSPEPKFRFQSSETYAVAAEAAKRLAANMDPDTEEYQNLARNYQALEHEYAMFNQHRAAKKEEEQARVVSRAAFLARRGIEPESEEAQMIELMHENGVQFERIEDMFLEPRTKMREYESGNLAHDQTLGHMTSATEIEEGEIHNNPPGSISQPKLTGDDYARNDLVGRYEDNHPSIDSLMFGE